MYSAYLTGRSPSAWRLVVRVGRAEAEWCERSRRGQMWLLVVMRGAVIYRGSLGRARRSTPAATRTTQGRALGQRRRGIRQPRFWPEVHERAGRGGNTVSAYSRRTAWWSSPAITALVPTCVGCCTAPTCSRRGENGRWHFTARDLVVSTAALPAPWRTLPPGWCPDGRQSS